MSHIVEIQTQVRDPIAIRGVCERLQLPQPVFGIHQLFTSSAQGWGISLRGWQYPVVCQTESGSLKYNNYGGLWGQQAELDRFLQLYAIEKTKLEARSKGYSVTEQSLADGSVKLTVQLGGAA